MNLKTFLAALLCLGLSLSSSVRCNNYNNNDNNNNNIGFTPRTFNGVRNAHRLREFIHAYSREANDVPPIRLDNVLARLGPLTGPADSLVNMTARSLLGAALKEQPYRYEVGETCLNHTEIFLNALLEGKSWALPMIDALGKPPSNILAITTLWLGSYEECVGIKAGKWISPTEQNGPFNGLYCQAHFNIRSLKSAFGQGIALTVGLCLPDSCSDADATVLTNLTVSLLPLNSSSPFLYTDCKRELEYSTKAKVVIVICSIFLFVMTIATLYDMVIVRGMLACLFNNDDDSELTDSSYNSFNGSAIISERTPLVHKENGGPAGDAKVNSTKGSNPNEYVPGLGGKLLLSFSVYSNALKILNTNQPAGTLTSVNGIRFISMTWVILGHTYAFCLTYTDNVSQYLPEVLSRFTFQCISNATVAVDTFFVLSGLLVSYLSLKEMRKRGGAGKFKWGMFYFHRFWRLTPPYMLFLMFYVPLFKYWSNGPLWPQQGVEVDECKDSWWWNLLYINNFTDMNKMCMAWSWYLANDMQFYVLSPILLVPLYYSPLWGSVTCLVFILVNFISTGVISSKNHLSTNLLFGGAVEDAFNDVYVKPWCRIGPYAVGFFTGYVLYKNDCKIRMSKWLNTLGWVLATAVSIMVLYGLYTSDGQAKDLGNDANALYNATSRTAWGMCIAWVVFACATGYGGPVNTLLSWHGVIPLSRLTYCAYLVHPVVMYVAYSSLRTPLHLYDFQMVYYFLGHVCLSYAVAFVVSLAFESPMMGLEKALLGRGKNS